MHRASSAPGFASNDLFGTAASLPRDCSFRRSSADLDTVFFHGRETAIGRFQCSVDHASFRDSGPIERAIVVFPRTSVWIQHEGSRRFVADPNVVTIYNRGQRYERAAISAGGDDCDWFAVSDALAREIVSTLDPRSADEKRGAFRFEFAHSTAQLYLEQRRLVATAAANSADSLELEERVIDIVGRVVRLAHHQRVAAFRPRRSSTANRQRDIVERAKLVLSVKASENTTVRRVADDVGASPFHLCRLFRALTGRSMHEYRSELRLKLLLARLADESGRANLSAIAHELGFASHAHLVRECRRRYGEPPRVIRAALS